MIILINPSNGQYFNPNQPVNFTPQGSAQTPGQYPSPFLNFAKEDDFYMWNFLINILPFIGFVISFVRSIQKWIELNKELEKYTKLSGHFAKKMGILPMHENDENFMENLLKNPNMYLQSYQYGNFKKMPEQSGSFSLFFFLSRLPFYVFYVLVTILFIIVNLLLFSGKSDKLAFFIALIFFDLLYMLLAFPSYKVAPKEIKLRNMKEKFGNLMEAAPNEIMQSDFFGRQLNEFADHYYNFIPH